MTSPLSTRTVAPRVDDLPIPDRLNIVLVLGVTALASSLVWLASQTTTWYQTLGVGVLFSYVMLTDYALLHEATHGLLHVASLAFLPALLTLLCRIG